MCYRQTIVLCLLLIVCSTLTSASIVITIPWEDEECYMVRTPPDKDSTVSGNFELLDDSIDARPLVVTVLNEKLRQLYKSPYRASEDTFVLETIPQNSRLTFCISNGIARKGRDREKGKFDRKVGFEFRVSPFSNQELKESATGFMELAKKLNNKLFDLKNHQDYMRNREALHRALTEQTFGRVVRWTVLEALTILLVAAGQVMYLRKFFEKKRYM